MESKSKYFEKKIIIVNQAVNYLSIGYCNAFNKRVKKVALITGSIHSQGEEIDDEIEVTLINKWVESPAWKKLFSYVKACLTIWILLMTKYRHYEVLFISIPPMAYLLNIILPHRFSMLIWDVYPDIFKVTGMKESHFIYRLWSRLNNISFNKAYRLITIGEKMRELLSQYVTSKNINIVPIWSIFENNDKIEKKDNPFIKLHKIHDKFLVQYSGNIGLTHNVEVLIDIAEKLQHRNDIIFQIIGRGPRKKVLKSLVQYKNLPNCKFLPFQSDSNFPYSLSAADLGVVILEKSVSKGSVPSKSYNLMSYGIPSLYIASKESELWAYSQKYGNGVCFEHNEIESAAKFIETIVDNREIWLDYSKNSLKASKKFKRSNANKLVELYLSDTDN